METQSAYERTMSRSFGLAGRTALVTGAARGIGLATVDLFLAEDAQVMAFDLPGDDYDAAMADRACPGLAAFAGDVTRSDDWANAVMRAQSHFGPLDILFNNAGIAGPLSTITSYPEAEFERVMAVNVLGVFLGIQHAARAMKTNKRRGVIINTSSVAGLSAGKNIHAYTASKHAVIGLTRSAAVELAPFNIRVNAVCPSPTATEMMFALERRLAPDDPQSMRATLSASTPMDRYAEAREIAAAVAFLASDHASFMTGVAMPVDGGLLAR